MCDAAVGLMGSCLSWDFQGAAADGGFGYTPEECKTAAENLLVTPGSNWRHVRALLKPLLDV